MAEEQGEGELAFPPGGKKARTPTPSVSITSGDADSGRDSMAPSDSATAAGAGDGTAVPAYEGKIRRRRDRLNTVRGSIERYLVLSGATGELLYYGRRGESKPRKTIQLKRETGVEMEHRGKMWTLRVTSPDQGKGPGFEFSVPTSEEAVKWQENIEAVAQLERKRPRMPPTRPTFGRIPRLVDRLFDSKENVLTESGSGSGSGSPRPAPVVGSLVVHSIHQGLTIYEEMQRGRSATERHGAVRRATERRNRTIQVSALCLLLALAQPVLQLCVGMGCSVITICLVCAAAAVYVLRFAGPRDEMSKIKGLLVNKAIRGTPTEIMRALLNISEVHSWDASVEECTVLETKDSHTDILHVCHRPVWVWPLWLHPRDLVLMRYWCVDGNGNAAIYLSSVEHPAAPISSRYVRGTIHEGGYFISPAKEKCRRSGLTRSLATMVVRYDPGWTSYIREILTDFQTLMALPILVGVHSLAEYMEAQDFEHPVLRGQADGVQTPPTATPRESAAAVGQPQEAQPLKRIESNVPAHMWGDVDGTTFMVRGPTYLQDKVKVPAQPSEFCLISCENVGIEEPLDRYHMARRPDTALAKALAMAPDFSLVLTFILSTKQCITMCMQPRRLDWREAEPSFAELFLDFIDGDDAFRNARLKLIPHLVEGPFLLRHVLTKRPVILGNKGVKVLYYRQPKYLEICIDLTSDRAVRSVTGLVLPATKHLTLDVAVLIEAQTADELPETILGGVRVNRFDLDKKRMLPPLSGLLEAPPAESVSARSASSPMLSTTPSTSPLPSAVGTASRGSPVPRRATLTTADL